MLSGFLVSWEGLCAPGVPCALVTPIRERSERVLGTLGPCSPIACLREGSSLTLAVSLLPLGELSFTGVWTYVSYGQQSFESVMKNKIHFSARKSESLLTTASPVGREEM